MHNMAREPTQTLNVEKCELIWNAFEERRDLSKAKLARKAKVHRSTVGRIVDRENPPKEASIRALEGIAEALNIEPELLIDQYPLPLEIDREFIAYAQDVLAVELTRIRREIGGVRAHHLTGIVGVHVHGVAPEKRIYESVFAFPRWGKRPDSKAEAAS